MAFKTVILDAGHGGIINGEYQTSGKRSPIWPDGSQLFEGEFNRAIKARLIEKLTADKINYIDINPEAKDISLRERVSRANKIKDCFYVSIHANAGGGKGSEVFISENASITSEIIAEFAATEYEKIFLPLLSSNFGYYWRGIKKKNFTVISQTYCPAILFECFFMDNQTECKEILLTKEGRDLCAKWIYNTIIKTFNYGKN
tara:strand:+ start:2461 stop:3066 length:606 start_codon:yes stop_codon:yes gene_type:complete